MNDQDENGLPEENSFINGDRPYTPLPERHGCVTAWLILILVMSSVVSLIYILLPDKIMLASKIPYDTYIGLLFLGVLNIVFSIMMLRWRKVGFYGFTATAIIGFVLNINAGISPVASTLGLCGIAILYGIFQIKKNGRSAWSYLK